MTFVKGHQKIGGRQKGTPNKTTIDFQRRLDENGMDPLALIAKNLDKLTPSEQVTTALKMLPYIYPIRKAIETSHDDSEKSPKAILRTHTAQILSHLEFEKKLE